MPIPPALLARLQKRGILKNASEPGSLEPEEEIIAEDYDDHQSGADGKPEEPANEENKENSKTALGCPNKWNVYHDCSDYCFTHWADGVKHPTLLDERRRIRMLRKYLLPDNWHEVYDPGTGRYYYWNSTTDEVSWLPPDHPKSKISMSSSFLRAIRKKEDDEKKRKAELDEEEDAKEEKSREESRPERRRDRDRDRERERDRDKDRDRDRRNRDRGDRDRDRDRDRSRGRARSKDDLDPMDPASYSDIPRGTWSSGLERKGEAKTGADSTASGPLYQMRPYPSPGAVLRANAEMQSKDKT